MATRWYDEEMDGQDDGTTKKWTAKTTDTKDIITPNVSKMTKIKN